MPVNQAFVTSIAAGKPYYRITSQDFKTNNVVQNKKVVNGAGARKNSSGGRYNYPGQVTVYITENIESCLAERTFYMQREVVRSLDLAHIVGANSILPVSHTYVLWEIVFKNTIQNICDLTQANAPALGVIPSLMLNPSQDYWHLKQRRADIEASGHSGIRAPSSRSTAAGHMVVLFADQSKNIQSITPFDADFRLTTPPPPAGTPFNNHATQILDFTSGEVRIKGSPSGNNAYNAFAAVPFNH